MKKSVICILLAVLMALTLASCGDKTNEPTTPGTPTQSADSTDNSGNDNTETTTIPANAPEGDVAGIKEVFNQLEYAAYLNIFYEKKGGEYENKVYNKEGTFAVLRDEYNNTDRYYVWGYADKTRCCDWQWEFIPNATDTLPAAGSLVKLKGKLVADEKALDGYHFVETSLTVVEEFKPADGFDMSVMSPTLARVQLANLQGHPEKFNGKSVRIFGRALNTACLQHPYYDNSWNLDVQSADGNAPFTTGQYYMVSGVFTAENGGSFVKATDIVKF